MKVAITGASGYVGGCIADGFRRHGHDVLSLSRRPCAAPWSSYSLGDDPASLPWQDIDVLVHAAYDFTARTPQEILEKNVHPSVDLLQTANQAGVGRLVFISSMSCFEGCRSDYGKAKRMVEKEALALGALVIRPGLVWGDGSGGVMGSLEKLVAGLPVVPFLTGGKHLHQYLIHQTDLAETIVQLTTILSSVEGALRTVAHPSPLTFATVLKTIARQSGLRRIFMPAPWQLVMAALKSAECLGLRCPFRSDSLIGLVHGNPDPEIISPPAGISYRPFQ